MKDCCTWVIVRSVEVSLTFIAGIYVYICTYTCEYTSELIVLCTFKFKCTSMKACHNRVLQCFLPCMFFSPPFGWRQKFILFAPYVCGNEYSPHAIAKWLLPLTLSPSLQTMTGFTQSMYVHVCVGAQIQ